MVSGDTMIIFTRLEPNRADADRCLGYLPVSGGTLLNRVCPGGDAADAMLDAWMFPAASVGGRLAYVFQQGRITSFAPGVRTLSVARIDAPDSTDFEINVLLDLFGELANAVRSLTWDGEDRLRFVAGLETFPLVDNVRDTVFSPLGLASADLNDGVVSEVSGGAGVIAFTRGPGAGWWVVDADDPARLRRLEGGVRTDVAVFSGPVVDLAVVSGMPLAAISNGSVLEWLDADSGRTLGALPTPGAVRRVSPAGGRRVIAEVEIGSGRDIWLISLP